MEVVHEGVPYTLNFQQQNRIIDLLNQSLSTNERSVENTSLNFTSLTIYRFEAPNLTLKPIAYNHEELIFSVPEWNSEGYLKENSRGEFKKLISTTFD